MGSRLKMKEKLPQESHAILFTGPIAAGSGASPNNIPLPANKIKGKGYLGFIIKNTADLPFPPGWVETLGRGLFPFN
jgi:hypothetical protein